MEEKVISQNRIYIKYPIKYTLIENVLKTLKKEKVNFFIDLNSICRGFYNSQTVLYEVGEYVTNGGIVTNKLLDELKDFLNDLYRQFKNFDPFFVIFYDHGVCLQNRLVMATYKSCRSVSNLTINEDERQTEIFRAIRHYYYAAIKEKFEKEDLCSVQYIPDYETDCVPHYCIKNNVFDAHESNVLNVILSIDKDLLQTCEYNNTIQCVTNYIGDKKTGKYNINFEIFDKRNALSYIYDKFNPGILTAKHLPIILSLAGDKSDEIAGITKLGPAKAIKLVESSQIPHDLEEIRANLQKMPQVVQTNIDLIIRNMKLISFDEQLKRLPREFLR